ncbi:MAG TPA: cation:proton antiporter, partial [Armatimonadaceae bacterium]|nr:cation:proton antiporter [Armatimonadaceae bacterium]
VYGGLFLGCALALSSTAVMLKILEERGELGTAHGTVMLGILVVQDLSLVLMIVLLPALAAFQTQGVGALSGVGIALLKAALFLGVTLLLATRGVPAVLDRVARTGSRELFLLAAVCLCLLAGFAADRLGLGIALGAFLAGIVVSESDFAHEVFSQVRPLRDVFASLFFVSVGMLLDLHFLVDNAAVVVAVVLVILGGKSLWTMFLLRKLGWQTRTVLRAGLGLAQIGEFSFVLATVGTAQGLIGPEVSGVILASALITILLAPFVYGAAAPLYRSLRRVPAFAGFLETPEGISEPRAGERPRPGARVIILGIGRVGRYVSDALRAKGVPHVVVDYDAAAVERLRANGVPTIYGDATSETVLAKAYPHQAELAVLTLPDVASTEMSLRVLKQMAPGLPVVARVHRGIDIPRIRQAGADAVIHAEFEAGTEMIRQGLDRLGIPDTEVDAYIEDVRQHRYRQEE